VLKNHPIVPYIPVSDMDRARRFWEEKVGLEAAEVHPEGVVYRCGSGSWVFLYQSAGAGTNRASCAFWTVDDVEKEVADLKKRGVEFEEYDRPGIRTVNGIATGSRVKTAWFKDTEGNIMALAQEL